MSTIDVMTWFDPCVLNWMLLVFVINGLVAYAWHKKFYLKFGLRAYKGIQRIHLNETPRIGGLIFILSLIGFVSQCHLGEGALIVFPFLFLMFGFGVMNICLANMMGAALFS